ncbi:MAG: hypothetical protein AB7E72_18240 [Lysobacterales bacterium]
MSSLAEPKRRTVFRMAGLYPVSVGLIEQQLTPEGLKRKAEVSASGPDLLQSAKRMDQLTQELAP